MSDNTKTTPTFIDTINTVVEKHLNEINVAMPGRIVSYNYAKNLAVVQPTLKRKYKNNESAIDLPVITNVPVAFQRMGKGHLRFPVNPGDTGQLVFNQRSIDAWLVSGGQVDPLDPRKFALSDGIFYPGTTPNNNPMASSAAQSSVELKLKNSYFEILDNGKFKITNSTEEAFDLLVQILGKMIEEMTQQGSVDTTNTIFGPLQPNNVGNYLALKADYETLKAKMETLKG